MKCILNYQIRNFINQNYRNCSYYTVKRNNVKSDKNKNAATVPRIVEGKLSEITLTKQIQSRILTTGPITIAEYMKQVLTNPSGGYYMSKDVFGTRGDFITSPEIGQIFGELIAVWCLNEWQKCGSPTPLQLIELGPGRGTLSQDILRVFAHFKMTKFSLHLVEISPFLSKAQSNRLCYRSKEIESEPFYRVGETISGINVFWYQGIEDVPNEFSILLAHEFFDALPIHKFQKMENVWKEILIDIDPQNKDKFRYITSREQTPMSVLFSKTLGAEDTREHVEVSFETDAVIQHVAKKFEEFGGFGLVMDYGHFGDKTDTFRSFKKHQLHDPLKEPGSADLTADVDFRHMKVACEKEEKLITFGPLTQHDFLKNMGGDVRLQVLCENNKDPSHIEQLKSGYEMLSHPDKMGSRFKFFSMFPHILKDHFKKFPVTAFEEKISK